MSKQINLSRMYLDNHWSKLFMVYFIINFIKSLKSACDGSTIKCSLQLGLFTMIFKARIVHQNRFHLFRFILIKGGLWFVLPKTAISGWNIFPFSPPYNCVFCCLFKHLDGVHAKWFYLLLWDLSHFKCLPSIN